MPEMLDRELFLAHEKYVERRFDRLEDLVKENRSHLHPDKVGWGGLLTVFITAGGLAVALLNVLP